MKRGYFIAVNTKTNQILTSGQSIYAYEDSAKRGVGQFVEKEQRPDYVVVEITPDDVMTILSRNDALVNSN